VIGAVFYALFKCCAYFELPGTAAALLLTAVPLIITGGFHVDGFMDVADALSSYRTKEEKLAILKDPHIGAFSVIRLALCGFIYIASLIIVLASDSAQNLTAGISAGFVLSRCLSAQSVLNFKSAKKEGMLYYEATSTAGGRKVNMIIVSLLAAAACFGMAFFAWTAGTFLMAGALLSFAWYKYLSYREFGGITGDTAGYFVVVCETAMAMAAAVSTLIIR
jgi:adenosylcobinamide-GDP ribazoletransferase